jgi:hypothetical protein
MGQRCLNYSLDLTLDTRGQHLCPNYPTSIYICNKASHSKSNSLRVSPVANTKFDLHHFWFHVPFNVAEPSSNQTGGIFSVMRYETSRFKPENDYKSSHRYTSFFEVWLLPFQIASSLRRREILALLETAVILRSLVWKCCQWTSKIYPIAV